MGGTRCMSPLYLFSDSVARSPLAGDSRGC